MDGQRDLVAEVNGNQGAARIPARFLMEMAQIPVVARRIGASWVSRRATRILEAFEPVWSSLRQRLGAAAVPASVYIACVQERIPRTFLEVATITNFSENEIKMCTELIYGYVFYRHGGLPLPKVRAEQLIQRYCDTMKISENVSERAIRIAIYAVGVNPRLGSKPGGVASAAIYISYKRLKRVRLSRSSISAQTKITRAQIRETTQEIRTACENVMDII